MNIALPVDLEHEVLDRVRSGRYASTDDVLRDAMRLLRVSDGLLGLGDEEIGERIDAGYESLKAGRVVDGDTVFDRLLADLLQGNQPSRT